MTVTDLLMSTITETRRHREREWLGGRGGSALLVAQWLFEAAMFAVVMVVFVVAGGLWE